MALEEVVRRQSDGLARCMMAIVTRWRSARRPDGYRFVWCVQSDRPLSASRTSLITARSMVVSFR